MALMFQRLARNYAKNGYFPTDSETTTRILGALQPADNGDMRILDPCCGEGVILAECKHTLGVNRTIAYGIEYNEERAWHAKQLLDHCIHADIHDCAVGIRQFGFLLLNPPYGHTVADRTDISSKSDRLEKLFYRRSVGLLQYGGVMALIIPRYSLDKEMSTWIARHFHTVRAYEAPEQQFKQVVIMGVRQRVEGTDTGLCQRLSAIGVGDVQAEVFPDEWLNEPYVVPAVQHRQQQDAKFYSARIDQRQLADIIGKEPGLWSRMELVFHYEHQQHRRPLRALSSWHLALALAAGQVSGVVKSRDGRTFVIKGDTFKDKVSSEELVQNGKGEVVGSKRIQTDRFVPTIYALDFTPESPIFGESLIIR
ncbi:MAG TPA: class I SAM-dependent methyltransferase [Gammaproteobacteria bacterium]|nr:class I SAM-dependent methyltransferase [Gammaproteobacteria bacterium]